MGKHLGTTVSDANLKSRRRVEICILFCLAILIISVTVTVILLRRVDPSISEMCGPNFPHFSVNISDAKEGPDGSYMSKDGMVFPKGTFYKSEGTFFGCPCSVKPCIRKCCAQNEVYNTFPIGDTEETNQPNKCVKTNNTFNISNRAVFDYQGIINENNNNKSIFVNDSFFYVFYGRPTTCKYIYPKIPEVYDYDENFLLDDGRIFTLDVSSPYRDQSQYCLESFVKTGTNVYTIECLPDTVGQEEEELWTTHVLIGGMLMSIPCLITTLVVYALLPERQNQHGKCLMCHVTCLIVAYGVLTCVQLQLVMEIGDTLCKISGYVIQFSFLASFCWLNVMCFDIWQVFSENMTPREGKRGQLKKFLLYSLYAWGVPLVIVALTAFIEYTPWESVFLVKPQLGISSCWFNHFDARTLYFYLPVGIMVALNLMMFSTTFYRIYEYSRKNDLKRLNSTESQRHNVSERHRFNLYLNLFIVMGVPWIMEVVSFAIGGSGVYWVITDLANSLQGLFIFVIFVCKRRILYQLNHRLCPRVRILGRTPTTSIRHSSTRTNLSRISSDNSAQTGRINSSML